MKTCRSVILWTSVLMGTMRALAGCAYHYDVAARQLSPPEQAEFALYRNVMTGAQAHTYLAKATAAERTAYLSEIGLAQRFQRLDPQDREAAINLLASQGMNREQAASTIDQWEREYQQKSAQGQQGVRQVGATAVRGVAAAAWWSSAAPPTS